MHPKPLPPRSEKVLSRKHACKMMLFSDLKDLILIKAWNTMESRTFDSSRGSPRLFSRPRPSTQGPHGPSRSPDAFRSWKSRWGTVDSTPLGTPVILQNTSTSSLTFPLTGASWTLLGMASTTRLFTFRCHGFHESSGFIKMIFSAVFHSFHLYYSNLKKLL